MAAPGVSQLAIRVDGAARPSVARDLFALGKPRITALSVLTGAAGMWLAPGPPAPWSLTLPTLLGLALLVGGAHALNQLVERETDALMARTRGRPLADRRLQPRSALLLGLVASGLALVTLGVFANLLSGALGAIALVIYTLVYTPLKKVTPHALLVGAVPGAMPALLGWTAASGSIGLPGLALFAMVALWQIPHFIAIAIVRREDYARAGIRTVVAVHGEAAAKRQALLFGAWLLAASLLLPASRAAGVPTLFASLLGGSAMVLGALAGLRPAAGEAWARRLFRVSLVYLPLLLTALGVERVMR